jgi:hypothetical protein
MPPNPSHRENDSATEERAGNQINRMTKISGTPIMSATTTRSRRVSRLAERMAPPRDQALA